MSGKEHEGRGSRAQDKGEQSRTKCSSVDTLCACPRHSPSLSVLFPFFPLHSQRGPSLSLSVCFLTANLPSNLHSLPLPRMELTLALLLCSIALTCSSWEMYFSNSQGIAFSSGLRALLRDYCG